MRNLYKDNREVPAIHPRYKASYNQLYMDESTLATGTFRVRSVVCILIFASYIMLKHSSNTMTFINDLQVPEIIGQNIHIIEFT